MSIRVVDQQSPAELWPLEVVQGRFFEAIVAATQAE